MKKSPIIVVSLLLLLVFFGSSSSGVETEARIGLQAPNFAVSNGEVTAQLQNCRGRYVVVTFWSSVDPESRMANIAHDRVAAGNARLAHIAVNYDSSEGVYRELVKLDSLDSGTQFYGNTIQGRALLAAWHQEAGYSSYLIDPQGRIVAKNPTTAMLKRI
jgi:hypothetical protein